MHYYREYGRFRDRKRLISRFRRRPLIAGIPAVVPLILVVVLLWPFGIVALIEFGRPDAPGVIAPPPPPIVEARVQTEGSDSRHRTVAFTVYVLSQRVSWRLESAT